MRIRHIGGVVAVLIGVQVAGASAQSPAPDAAAPFSLRYSIKSSLLLSRWPDDPALFPDQGSATGFWLLRIEPTVRLSDRATIDVAFEQRLRAFSSATSVSGANVLPSEASAPFRIGQLDWRFASSSNFEWRGEIDRAALHLHGTRSDLTIGRQAIGWGRGVLFGAVDLFAPFTPLEADREWRRGVDAVRADVKIGDRLSLDTVGAFADALGHSIVATRVRGYAGTADVELLGGYRAGDGFAGATASAAIGDAEVHGELALFLTPATPGSIAFARARSIAKVVVGGSYRLPAGNGLLLFAEYHYSGFGAASADGVVAALQDPKFQERYLRGDTQMLTRHAVAVLASYEVSPELTVSSQWLQSPVDGSGVLVPSATWTLSDRWSVLFSGYVPYGRRPDGHALRSAFGASPLSAFVQINTYR
jgi:hypothetical protein